MLHTICHWVKKVVYIVAIIALINMGLQPFGYDIFQTDFMLFTVPWLDAPLHYIAGIAGILLLVKLVACLTGKSACMCGGEYGKENCATGCRCK